MSTDADVIIIGSGLSGVSAAWPMVKAGLNVLMLDQGRESSREESSLSQATFFDRRMNDHSQWKSFIGDDFFGLGWSGNETPKMKVPAHRFVMRGFVEANNIHSNEIVPTGSLSKGGLSRMWGAGPYGYNQHDLSGTALKVEDLTDSYKTVAKRMGISGIDGDDVSNLLGPSVPLQKPLPLHPNADLLLRRYEDKKVSKDLSGFNLGYARNAVLTESINDRGKCEQLNMCMWGCPNNAIYSADQDLPRLMSYPNFKYQDGAFVKELFKQGEYWSVNCQNLDDKNEPHKVFKAKKIVLAAGTIGSTKLVLSYLKSYERPIDVLCHPAFAMVFILPSRIGASSARNGFALGQLAYCLGQENNDSMEAFGVVFGLEGLLASDIIRNIPFSRFTSIAMGQSLLPSMLVANCYLPGSFSSVQMCLKQGDNDELHITGGYTQEFIKAQKDIQKRVARAFRKIGAFLLPGGTQLAKLGSDGHFVGSMPINSQPTGIQVSTECELADNPGLYVVDGAVLPKMSAKHPTFTIMANADRVGRIIAGNLLS